jgi:hypothetical protein
MDALWPDKPAYETSSFLQGECGASQEILYEQFSTQQPQDQAFLTYRFSGSAQRRVKYAGRYEPSGRMRL